MDNQEFAEDDRNLSYPSNSSESSLALNPQPTIATLPKAPKTPTSKSLLSSPLASPTSSPNRTNTNLQMSNTKSSEMSFDFDNYNYDDDDMNSLSNDNNDIDIDINGAPNTDTLNEEELKTLARSLAPRVTSLLDTNEKVLEDLINQDLSWGDNSISDGNGNGHTNTDSNTNGLNGNGSNIMKKLGGGLLGHHKNNHMNGNGNDNDSYDSTGLEEDGKNLYRKMEEYRLKEEDGMEDEWNHLSNAEQMLRDELGMVSMGFNFVVNENDDDDDGEEDGDYYDEDGEEDEEVQDGDYNPDIVTGIEDKIEKLDIDKGNNVQTDDTATNNIMNGTSTNTSSTSTSTSSHQNINSQISTKNLLDNEKEENDEDVQIDKDQNRIIPVQQISSNNNDNDNKTSTTSTTASTPTLSKVQIQKSNITTPPALPLPSSSNRQTYTLYDHAKYVDLQFSNTDLGYPTCPLLTQEDAEALLDVPSFRHEMLTIGGDIGASIGETDFTSESSANGNMSTSNVSNSDLSSAFGGTNHEDGDDLQRATSTKFKDKKSRQEAIREIMLCTREYIKPMTRSALSRIYEGLVDKEKSSLTKKMKQSKNQKHRQKQKQQKDKKGGNDISDDDEDRGVSITSNGEVGKSRTELLPVRTIAIQIRSDVLCGAVMDAVHTAIHSLRGEIIRRQGNHLRALVPGCWVPESSYMSFRPTQEDDKSNAFVQLLTSQTMSPINGVMNGMVFLPPFVVDAQLCTRKRSRDGERICLFRFFRIQEHQVVDGNTICPPSPPHANMDTFNADLIPDLKECNTILRESSALFQRMRDVATAGGNIAFEIGSDGNNHEDAGIVSPGEVSNASENESYMRQVFTSPLKLFSPSKEKKARLLKKKRTAKKANKSLSVRFQSDSVIQGEKAAQTFASEKLLNMFIATPSVMDENENQDIDPIPSLSNEDWPFVQSSWRYITLCLNEIDNRDLNYSSLVSCPFGAFPALPTLDVQLCSQIKALCKDNMIASLLKGAQELEEFAREAEYSCAKLIQLLQPSFLSYNLEPPTQPDAISLATYPLDFTPPEVSCPPWGLRVVEALNLVAAKSPSADSCFLSDLEFNATPSAKNIPQNVDKSTIGEEEKTEFQKAREAASMVLAAFMIQEDEELSARLGRKNLQVMDRLAKMQAHKRELIITIRDSYGTNLAATKFANRFHAYAQQVAKPPSDDDEIPSSTSEEFYPASDQIPLITCRSLSGKVPATCFVTSHQILLVTHPILGDANTHLARLCDISVHVSTSKAKSLLNPIPSTVIICSKKDKKEIFSFRPLMGARPFKEFIDLLADMSSETEEALQFSSRGGLLYMFDEKKSVEKAALGTEES